MIPSIFELEYNYSGPGCGNRLNLEEILNIIHLKFVHGNQRLWLCIFLQKQRLSIDRSKVLFLQRIVQNLNKRLRIILRIHCKTFQKKIYVNYSSCPADYYEYNLANGCKSPRKADAIMVSLQPLCWKLLSVFCPPDCSKISNLHLFLIFAAKMSYNVTVLALYDVDMYAH